MIKEKIYARIKTEDAQKHIESLFENVEFVNTDDLVSMSREVILYEVMEDCTKETLNEILSTENFFIFISDICHDNLLLELSKEHYFTFTLKSDPVNEITIRFNALLKHKELTIELEKKNEEMESTIFELAFASTNVLEQNEFLEQMAKKDGLTMLFNHSYFKDKLKDEMVRSERYNNCFTIAILDLDFFKRVNDQYGHVKGDEVLKAFANIIKETVRNTDIAARYGGEEFAIIFTETDITDAVVVLDRIREKLNNTIFSSETVCFKVTFSAGVTEYSKSYRDVEYMVNIADKALYISKSEGRNRTTILNAEDL
ncbi:diguanylate cyclase [Denitrovibrio acetiphilus DSM 12809]|uniref:diguanylate cyclase n=1 Tax=Denitrovibrio acetiphilus (strain DSM 12809 / NBRC 114555 / N2460) TaxID=522772 RepID=D4H7N5_DENA2|nr:GGDEF domain-containing protein [Denitrovibrio acetiphilus]ADD68034.1 diguanylate cyclase [Denitrovibrio acetiphilus DSM 12809]